jgi:hypothetical protein
MTATSKTEKTKGKVRGKRHPGAIRATKASLKVQAEVDAFNRRFNVGDHVHYYPSRDAIERTGIYHPSHTVTQAFVSNSGDAVVHLKDYAGYVLCSHCFPPPGVGG